MTKYTHTPIGDAVLNAPPSQNNCEIGYAAMKRNTGPAINTGLGYIALNSTTTGYEHSATLEGKTDQEKKFILDAVDKLFESPDRVLIG